MPLIRGEWIRLGPTGVPPTGAAATTVNFRYFKEKKNGLSELVAPHTRVSGFTCHHRGVDSKPRRRSICHHQSSVEPSRQSQTSGQRTGQCLGNVFLSKRPVLDQ